MEPRGWGELSVSKYGDAAQVNPMSSEGLGKWGQVCWSHPYCVQGSGTEG